jgi:hypothetical protein
MTRLLKFATLTALVLLFLARVPEVFSTPQFWADEGLSFFRDAWCYGCDSLLRHYSGYYHVIPRFMAYLASFAPPLHAPALYIFSAVLLTALVLCLVLSERLPLHVRPLLALAVILVPHDGEVFANLTNIQWILAIGLIVMVLMRPGKSKLTLAGDAAFVTLAGLTGPYIVTVLPAFIAGLWRSRRDSAGRNRLLLLSLLATATSYIQMYSVHFTNEDKKFQYQSLAECLRDLSSHLGNLFEISVARVFGSSMYSVVKLFNRTGQDQIDVERIVLVSIVLFLIFAVMIGHDLITSKKERFPKLICVYFVAALLFAAFYRNKGLASSPLDPLIFTASDRYFYIPKVMLVWLLLLMPKRGWNGILALIFLVTILTTTLQNYRRVPWMDLNWKYWVRQIEVNRPLKIPINPIGWKIDLVCTGK